MFKRMQLLALVAGLLVSLACTGNVFARGTSNIAATVHNLSTTSPDSLAFFGAYQEFTEDRICIFCHTPHAGQLDTPLWNKDISSLKAANYFTHYDSATLSSVIKGDINRAVSNESLLCLSCHDGSIAVGDLVNTSVNGAPDSVGSFILGFGTTPGAQIGGSTIAAGAGNFGDLRDDHPISFNYDAVVAQKPLDFIPLASVDAGLHFAGAAKNRLECSTCHDPHVDYIAQPAFYPFLAKSNAGSALCLSCHIK